MQNKLASLMEDYSAEQVHDDPRRLADRDPGRQPPKRAFARPVDVDVTKSRQSRFVEPHSMQSRVDFQPLVDVQPLPHARVDVQDVRQPAKLTCFDVERQAPQSRVVLTAQSRQSRQSRVDVERPPAPVVVARQVSPLLETHQLSDEAPSDEDVADPHPDDNPSDVDEPKAVPPSMDFKKIMMIFKELFPDHFVAVAPRSPPSEFALGLAATKPAFTKLVLSRSSKRALRLLGDWLDTRRSLGKTAFAFPPSKLASRSSVWYDTGEVLGLGVPASAQGDFSSLVDSPSPGHETLEDLLVLLGP
ncbi:uncharacterized protein [Palaemon carinicauda]|uniref:uncharacterized protein n=1 Tax=Palaemon carinicauda TaxID=392227 RepID=UPI0035B58D12